jgi:hypothetical protein
MSLAESLHNYRIGRFTDEDVVRCTGLSVRGWRELIKFRVVRTVTENDRGRGHVRLCDKIVFKRAAVIGALSEPGFSLAVAGRIAYFVPFHSVLFDICDPGNVSLQVTDSGSLRLLPLSLRKANARWFNPARPTKADPKTDWLVQIHDRRFVSVVYRPAAKPVVFGGLRDEGTRFVAWVPHNAELQFVRSTVAKLAMAWAPSGERLPRVVSEWEEPTKSTSELRSLGYEVEKHAVDDPLRRAAEATVRNPLSTTTVNVSLAIRRAIRRYLGIERIEPKSENLR